MTSPTTLEALKRQAIEVRGLSAILMGACCFAFIGGVIAMIDGWFGRGDPLVSPSLAALISALALGGVIAISLWHQRRYMAAARRAGLSDAEAKALADQADDEDGA